jgi:phosphogluconate dehydratase
LGGGPLSLLQSGDMIRLCGNTGTLSTTADLTTRTPAQPPLPAAGTGRELFAMFRTLADEAEKGGSAMLASAGL